MWAILTMMRMHLVLVLQDRATYIQAFVVPAVLMVILGLALNQDNFTDPSVLVDVVDADGSALAAVLLHQLENSGATDAQAIVPCVYGTEMPSDCGLKPTDRFEDLGQSRLEDRTVAAALIIPAGFGENLEKGMAVSLEYRSDDGLDTQSVARAALDAAVTQLTSSIHIARVGVQTTEQYFGGYPDEQTKAAAFTELYQAANTALNTPPVVMASESTGEQILPGTGTRQSIPGIGSMFVMFSLLSLSQFLVEERTQGTLQRLFTLPTRKTYIVIGKILGAFAFGVAQFGIFIFFGALMGVEWGKDPLAVAALVAAFCLAGTALGFLLATFVRTTAQAGTMITLFGLVLAPLGGAWWPLTIVPNFLRVVGHVSPIAWLMDGFAELLYYDGGLLDVLPMVGALLGFALIFGVVGIRNFRYE